MSDLVIPFGGYIGQVWAKCFAAMNYLSEQLSASPSPSTVDLISTATLATFLNGLEAINTYSMAAAWTAEIGNLNVLQALPILLDPTSQALLAARSSTYVAAAPALSAIVPQPPFPMITASVAQGLPAIPSAGLLEFYAGFSYETPISGTIAANFVAQAQLAATSFYNIATAVQVLQGGYLTLAYDTALRQAQSAQLAANILANFSSGPITADLPVMHLWNQNVVLPTLCTDGQVTQSTPYLLVSQQSAVIRYALLTLVQQLSLFLLIIRSPNASQITQATLDQGQTLLDIANNVLGNFEQWTTIAALNNLQPPYITANGALGTARPGQKLIMPTPGSATSSTGMPPNYAINYLGVDLYLGPLNEPMLPWQGDFQTISGFQNLGISLGRRLQTTLGTLIYHPDFGSRIPPEVGSVQDTNSAGQIQAFGVSALLTDPRVQAVLSASATPQPNYAIAFSALVQPGGFGSTATSVNEVISAPA